MWNTHIPPYISHTNCECAWVDSWCLMSGGCWCLSKAPDPSGAVFDLGLCSLVLEQPAQVQRRESTIPESKRVNQLFDLLHKRCGKYGKQSVLRRNLKRSLVWKGEKNQYTVISWDFPSHRCISTLIQCWYFVCISALQMKDHIVVFKRCCCRRENCIWSSALSLKGEFYIRGWLLLKIYFLEGFFFYLPVKLHWYTNIFFLKKVLTREIL